MPANTTPSVHFGKSTLTIAPVLALLLLSLGLSLAWAPSSFAHDQLISSTPKPGEHLDQAPTSLKFSFSASLLSLGNEVLVMDTQGKDWAQGSAVLSAEVLTQALAPELPDGEYTIRWRVVSSDGHPISSTQTFLVGQATAAAKPAATEVATQPPTPIATQDAQVPANKLAPIVIGALTALGSYIAFVVIGRARKNTKQTR